MNETPCSLTNKCDFIYSYWRGSLPESVVNARDKALFYLFKSKKLKESGKGTSVINSWYVKMRVEGKAFFINLVDPRNTTRNPGSTAPNPGRVLHITSETVGTLFQSLGVHRPVRRCYIKLLKPLVYKDYFCLFLFWIIVLTDILMNVSLINVHIHITICAAAILTCFNTMCSIIKQLDILFYIFYVWF